MMNYLIKKKFLSLLLFYLFYLF